MSVKAVKFNEYISELRGITGLSEDDVRSRESVQEVSSVILGAIEAEDGAIPGSLSPERAVPVVGAAAEHIGAVPAVATLATPPEFPEVETLLRHMDSMFIQKSDIENLFEKSILTEIDAILHSDSQPTKDQLRNIYNFFNKKPLNFTVFLNMKGKNPESRNLQFDAFLCSLDPDLYNEKPELMHVVQDYAFSAERFEAIQIDNDLIGEALMAEMQEYERQFISLGHSFQTQIEELKEVDPIQYDAWLRERMRGSGTIEASTSEAHRAKAAWIEADKKVSSMVPQAHSNSIMGVIKLIHKRVAKDQSDVINPGQFHTETVRIGAGVLGLPPHGLMLNRLSQFEIWLTEERAKCARGEKSKILTAAQAYQRLVSIHPFENANGRTSRLLMDYILESFDLPPAILNGEVLDAVFPFAPRQDVAKASGFIRKVFTGVQLSHQMIIGR